MSTTTDGRPDLQGIEGGRSVEDMVESGELPEEEDGQLAIPGTSPKLNLTVGGARPSVSVAKIRSLRLPVRSAADGTAGQFEKEDTIKASITLTCVDIQFPTDPKTGLTQRVHVFAPEGIEVTEIVE